MVEFVMAILTGFVLGFTVASSWQLHRDTKRRAAKEAKRHKQLGLCVECDGSGVIRAKDTCDSCSACSGTGLAAEGDNNP